MSEVERDERWKYVRGGIKLEESEQGWGHYSIFVFSENTKINLMRFDGSDGNGYYGTGYRLLVRLA